MSPQEDTNARADANGSSNASDTGANNSQNGGGPQESETSHLSSQVQQILGELRSATEARIDLSFVDMEENEAELIGEAIASSQHLEELTLQLDPVLVPDTEDDGHRRPNDTVLSKAFLGPQPNTSVRALIIAGSGTDGDLMLLGVLPQVIRENSHLTRLEFQWRGDDGTSLTETRKLFDSLLHNSTLQTLVLPRLVRWDFENSEDGGFIDAETFSEVVRLVESNASITDLDVQIGECRGPGSEDLNLPAFYNALRSNTTIKTLHLRDTYVTRKAESEFLKWIQTTASLEELCLEPLEDYYADEEEVPLRYKLLFRSLRDNKSLKKLVLDGSSVEADEDFRELMDAIAVNSTLQEIVFDPPENGRAQAVREGLQSRAPREPDTEQLSQGEE